MGCHVQSRAGEGNEVSLPEGRDMYDRNGRHDVPDQEGEVRDEIMWYQTPAQQRYRSDPTFRALTDFIYAFMDKEGAGSKFTPTELREACMLAATMWECRNIRPFLAAESDQKVYPW